MKSLVGKKFNKLTIIEVIKFGRKEDLKCQCDCEKIVILKKAKVLSGHNKSCGCSKNSKKIHIEKIFKILESKKLEYNHIYEILHLDPIIKQSWYHDRYKIIDYNLFKKMIFQNCFYCNSPPSTKLFDYKRKEQRENYILMNGIDHVIPYSKNKTYDYNNLVTCCFRCNLSKREYIQEEFIHKICKSRNFILSNKLNELVSQKDISKCFLRQLAKTQINKINYSLIAKPILKIRNQTIDEVNLLLNNKIINIVGNNYNNLTVIAFDKRHKNITYWKCVCNLCNKEVSVNGQSLKRGMIKSCGVCQRIKYKKSPWKTSLIISYSHYKDGNITLEQFYNLSQLPCFYCGELKSNTCNSNKKTEFKYNGLDRISSKDCNKVRTKHYLNNIVTCCKQCNWMKSDLEYGDYISWVLKCYNNLKLKGLV